MRRSYVEAHVELPHALKLARVWAGPGTVTVVASSTAAVTDSPELESSGLPIGTTSHRGSRFAARPDGAAIAWCLSLPELLELESRRGVDAVVLVQASARHSAWVSAYQPQCLGGELIDEQGELSAPARATVEGLTHIAQMNALTDSRERSAVVQAMTSLRTHRVALEPGPLLAHALRCGWPGRAGLELERIATELNTGKALRFQKRLSEQALARWAAGESV